MKAKNISNGVLNLESGQLKPSDSGELTKNEYSFLSNQGLVGPADVYVPSKVPTAPKKTKKVEAK